MNVKSEFIRFSLGTFVLLGALYFLATSSPNANNIFGPITLLFLYGPIYFFDTLGLPVLRHTEIFGTITFFGWILLAFFYFLVSYGCAWVWVKIRT